MKVFGAFVVLVLTVILIGCGAGEEATSAGGSSTDRTATGATPPKQGNFPLPKLPPKRRPLEKLYIKDLEIGKGPAARWGDEVVVRYMGMYWRTGKIFTRNWDYATGHQVVRGSAHGWMTGLLGMRAGGRRELRIPSRLLYEGGDGAYVVTIDKVKRGAAKKDG